MPDSDESRHAREYTYGRWPEEFCSIAGIGYTPHDGGAFMEFCRAKGLDEDALFELGLLRRGDDGHVYAMFRHRIMIPIRNRWGAHHRLYRPLHREQPEFTEIHQFAKQCGIC